eukprot:PhM_4_TR17315/c0_g1_i1/m.69448
MESYFNLLAGLLRQNTNTSSQAEAWLRILRRGTTSTELNYSHMGLSMTTVMAVISCLHELRDTVNRINLAGNGITDVAVGPLTAAVRALPHIVLVDLSSNSLTDAAVEHIFRNFINTDVTWRLSSNSNITAATAVHIQRLNKRLHRSPNDVDRLRQRRDEIFHAQSVETTEDAIRERDRLRNALLRDPEDDDDTANTRTPVQNNSFAQSTPTRDRAGNVSNPDLNGSQTMASLMSLRPAGSAAQQSGSGSGAGLSGSYPTGGAAPGGSTTQPITSAQLHSLADIPTAANTVGGGGGDGDTSSTAPTAEIDGEESVATRSTEVIEPHDFLDLTINAAAYDRILNMSNKMLQYIQHRALQLVTILVVNHNLLTVLPDMPPSLLRLDVSDNQLQRISGLSRCKQLHVLNIRRNALTSLDGLQNCLQLQHIFAGHNNVQSVTHIEHLYALETLDLAYCPIRRLRDVRPLSVHPNLCHLLLAGTPFSHEKGYRPMLLNLCPQLLALDNNRLPLRKRRHVNLSAGSGNNNNSNTSSINNTNNNSSILSSNPNNTTALGGDIFLHTKSNSIVGPASLPSNTSVGNPTGNYSAPGKVAHAMRVIADFQAKLNEAEKKKRFARVQPQQDVLQQLMDQMKEQEDSLINSVAGGRGTSVPAAPDGSVDQDVAATTVISGGDDERPSVVQLPLDTAGRAHNGNASATAAAANPAGAPRTLVRHSASLTPHQWQAMASRPPTSARKPSSTPAAGSDKAGAPRPSVQVPKDVAEGIIVKHAKLADEVVVPPLSAKSPRERSASGAPSLALQQQQLPHQGVPSPADVAKAEANAPLYPLLGGAGRAGKSSASIKKSPSNTPVQRGMTSTSAMNYAIRSASGSTADTRTRASSQPTRSASALQPPDVASTLRPAMNLPTMDLSMGTDSSDVLDDDDDVHEESKHFAESAVQATPARRVQFAPYADVSLLVEEETPEQHDEDGQPIIRHSDGSSPSTHHAAFDVKAWLERFAIDFRTVYYALKALCLLAEADSPPELAQYRHLLDSRGILKDTELPEGLIRYYSFTEVELNDPTHQNQSDDDLTERGRVLALLHQMGETKTCLRYILALIDHKRRDLLTEYLSRVKLSIAAGGGTKGLVA